MINIICVFTETGILCENVSTTLVQTPSNAVCLPCCEDHANKLNWQRVPILMPNTE